MTTANYQLDPSKRKQAIAIDFFSAITAACCVAPGIKIVDQGKNMLSNENFDSIMQLSRWHFQWFVDWIICGHFFAYSIAFAQVEFDFNFVFLIH